MWVLVLCLAFGEPGRHSALDGPQVATFATEEACDAARWDWWRRDALPEGYEKGWFQFMPGTCEQVELVG